MPGHEKKLEWKCPIGHIYKMPPMQRTRPKNPSGCGVCNGKIVLVGFNDLLTRYPEVAAEADGWDPSKVAGASNKSFRWKCPKGHTWTAAVCDRTTGGNGCPSCKTMCFDRDKPSYFYLISRPGEQQFGITNNFDERVQTHGRSGWQLLDSIGPIDGELILETERPLKRWLKARVGRIQGTQENWQTTKFEVQTLAELFKRSEVTPLWEEKT